MYQSLKYTRYLSIYQPQKSPDSCSLQNKSNTEDILMKRYIFLCKSKNVLYFLCSCFFLLLLFVAAMTFLALFWLLSLISSGIAENKYINIFFPSLTVSLPCLFLLKHSFNLKLISACGTVAVILRGLCGQGSIPRKVRMFFLFKLEIRIAKQAEQLTKS